MLVPMAAGAQEQFSSRYNTTYVTMENGLLHNFIDDIYKDSQGFLWFSTGGGGLSRYDGYEFVHYSINTSPVKLKSNFIRTVCEDNFSRLWIVSEGGTDILDLKKLQLIIPPKEHSAFTAILSQPIINVTKDSLGAIWLCGHSSLYKITFKTNGEVADIYTLSNISINTQAVALSDIDKDGHIWIGIENKVCKVYPAEKNTLKAVLISPLLEFEQGTLISAFCSKENEVWIGTNKGLFRYNQSEEIIKRYEYEKGNPHSITQSFITDIKITKDKQLLVSTLRGINVYNQTSNDFEQITQEVKHSRKQLNSNFINCMYIDGDIIWIGSETGGVNKMTPRRLSARSYIYNKDEASSISPNPVNAIFEDQKGNLWVGTVEGGLNRKANGSDHFVHYTADAPAFLSHNSVSAITADDKDRLWVGTWGNGVTLLNLNSPTYATGKYISSQTHQGAPIDFIGSLCYDPINNGIWIGTNPGIYFYDLATDSIHAPFSEEVTRSIHGSIGSMIDPSGNLWMGSMEGVYLIHLHSRKDNRFQYTHLKFKLDNPSSGLIEKSACFCLTSNGTIWVGSNGNGIYKYFPTEKDGKGTFITYTTEQGLINNNIRGILEDERGRLWISTNNGLSCFDPLTERFTNYTKEDGLTGNQFYWNAYCKSQKGLLYFGGLTGLTVIEANRKETTPAPAHITLTRLLVANEEIYPGNKYIDTNISIAKTLHLHESDKSFSLEFSALNYEAQLASVYSYRLLGFDDNWVEVPSTRRFASYTNIPSGKYTFQVRYSSQDFANEDIQKELEVIVTPFFYKTWWFILSVILTLGCSVAYYYIRRIHLLQKQQKLLHQMVEERTRELKEQNEKITKQKSQLIQMSKKVQELTLDKLSFFTNITHEFRTPITLIIGPIERALKLSYNPQVIEQLHFVERNSKYLLSLVNQLMDFRKVESGKLEIVQGRGNFLKFIDSLVLPFEAFAGERNIQLRKLYHLTDPFLLFDQDAMHKVITNLLSNAIKFTPDNGIVTLYVASCSDKESDTEKLYISVSDTGIGISEEDLPKIFNRFYQSNDHSKFPVYGQSGTGIGLYLSKRIVKLHGGTITARNHKKTGSTFSIVLPLLREDKNNPVPLSGIHPQLSTEAGVQPPIDFVPGKLTILIVEDNKDMRAYIRSILSEQYNIFEAENGEEALHILAQSNVDFIISDLMMPVMDGIELSKKVKENFSISHIPFLMLTAKTAQESRIESYKMGVDEYLLKPFNEELLLTRITNILENRKRYQKRFAMSMEVKELQIEEESSDKKFLDKALDILKANYKNSYYEASDFIEAMGVSKSLLNKKMQSLTGQSIGQFIRNYRLSIARELIERNKITKNLNISEIAYEVGFNDPKYFTRCFTKRYNTTPSSLME
nr:two-component regulator propeller domain-containing protein [Bacteroides sp. 224]